LNCNEIEKQHVYQIFPKPFSIARNQSLQRHYYQIFQAFPAKRRDNNKNKMLHPLLHYTPTNHISQTNGAEKISIHHFAIYEDM